MPASPVHHTSVDKTSAWDGGAAEKRFDKKASDFKLFYAWYDTGEVDPDATGEDKEDGWGPHHDVNDAGVPGAANLAGVHAAMARLNQDTKIPAGDRQGVHNHLAAHLKDAGVDPVDIPELKSAAPRAKSRVRREFAQGLETRFFTPERLEVRSGVGGNPDLVELKGLVIRYDVPYEVYDMWGSFTETIHQGAATDVLASKSLDVRFLFNHADMPFARTGSQQCPLVLTEDTEGVHVSATVDTRMQGAADLVLAVENGLVTQMSVGMEVDPDEDQWHGEDDWGMPNKREIYRLANIFDASGVTYPASTTTTLALARMAGNARDRQMWLAARDVRAGRGSQAQGEAVMRFLEKLAEHRDAPTDADGKVADDLAAAHQWLSAAKADQAKDPDTNSDPDDKKVANLVDAALEAVAAAMDAQAKDGNPDKPAPDGGGKETKSDEPDETQGDPDGTNVSGDGNAPVPDNQDGTGTRAVDPHAGRRAALRERQRKLGVERARLRAGSASSK